MLVSEFIVKVRGDDIEKRSPLNWGVGGATGGSNGFCTSCKLCLWNQTGFSPSAI